MNLHIKIKVSRRDEFQRASRRVEGKRTTLMVSSTKSITWEICWIITFPGEKPSHRTPCRNNVAHFLYINMCTDVKRYIVKLFFSIYSWFKRRRSKYRLKKYFDKQILENFVWICDSVDKITVFFCVFFLQTKILLKFYVWQTTVNYLCAT